MTSEAEDRDVFGGDQGRSFARGGTLLGKRTGDAKRERRGCRCCMGNATRFGNPPPSLNRTKDNDFSRQFRDTGGGVVFSRHRGTNTPVTDFDLFRIGQPKLAGSRGEEVAPTVEGKFEGCVGFHPPKKKEGPHQKDSIVETGNSWGEAGAVTADGKEDVIAGGEVGIFKLGDPLTSPITISKAATEGCPRGLITFVLHLPTNTNRSIHRKVQILRPLQVRPPENTMGEAAKRPRINPEGERRSVANKRFHVSHHFDHHHLGRLRWGRWDI